MSGNKQVINALENGTFTKIICGAANTNEKHVERLALVYALSGADVIDISPSNAILQAAQSGIKKASELYNKNPEDFPDFKEPLIMLSLNCGDDLHFRKAEINPDKCINCFNCINSCPANAIYISRHCELSEAIHQLSSENWIATSHPKDAPRNDNIVQIKKENCYGCGRCINACLLQAIDFVNLNNSLTEIDVNMVKGIEVHTGRSSIKDLSRFLKLNEAFFKNIEVLSFSVESKRFNYTELQNYVSSIIKLIPQKIIIQIDGIPMGATDEPNSSLQTLSSAGTLLEKNINAYIQLSGGTNHFTKSLVRQLGLKISGIGYGTFARKIILSYLEEVDDLKFMSQLLKIVNITTSLVKS